MLPFEDRYTRQRQLPEVGMLGQQRLAQAVIVAAADLGSVVELSYLHRAGIGRVEFSITQAPIAFPHLRHFRHPGPSRFAAGAYRALKRIRDELGAQP